ncbi:polyphenol oxidase family protein, partial [Paracoccaceae bacterium]|nr:polyphenol oxidase family protein [Paracoccaceae bacterium]
MVAIFKSKNLDNITHAFFGRTGGTSTGIYCSLNFSKNTNDDNLNVERNHELAFDKINISKKQIFFPNQQHTNRVLFINEKSKVNSVRHTAADAVITNVEKFGVGILSADCCPVLAFESDSGIIVAIHAGWKGALSGICENTLSVLKKLNVNL